MRELTERIRRREALRRHRARLRRMTVGPRIRPCRVPRYRYRCGRPKIDAITGGDPTSGSRRQRITEQVDAGRLNGHERLAVIRSLDTINICVPTPLRKDEGPGPDLHRGPVEEIRNTCAGAARHPREHDIPGTTEEWSCPPSKPPASRRARTSAWRSRPSGSTRHPHFSTRNIRRCGRHDVTLYAGGDSALRAVHRACHPGFVDSRRRDVKLLETPSGASTSGWSMKWRSCATRSGSTCGGDRGGEDQAIRLHALLPGPGLGGHCIPIDPFYLSWKAKAERLRAPLHRAGGTHQREHAALRGGEDHRGAQLQCKSVRGARIHVLGVAYKAGVNDVREVSSAERIKIGCDKEHFSRQRPVLPAIRGGLALARPPCRSQRLPRVGRRCVVVLTDHRESLCAHRGDGTARRRHAQRHSVAGRCPNVRL